MKKKAKINDFRNGDVFNNFQYGSFVVVYNTNGRWSLLTLGESTKGYPYTAPMILTMSDVDEKSIIDYLNESKAKRMPKMTARIVFVRDNGFYD